jgi:hypothetical protein
MTRARATTPGIRRGVAIAALTVAVLGGVAVAQISPPLRKAGWWETTMIMNMGGRQQTMVTQGCTDEATEKASSVFSAGVAARGNCTRRDVTQIPGGWQSTSVCNFGSGTRTSTATVTGDYQSHLHMELVSESAHGPDRTVMEMKWLGACPAGRKPGDVVLPGGMVVNTVQQAPPH